MSEPITKKKKTALKGEKKQSLNMMLQSLFFVLGVGFTSFGTFMVSEMPDAPISMYLIPVFGGTLISAAGLFIRSISQNLEKQQKTHKILQKRYLIMKKSLAGQEELNQTLQQLEDKNRDIIDSIKDVIFEVNEDGKILFLNKSWQDMTGFEIEQSLGQLLFNVIHQGDQDNVRGEYERLTRGKIETYRAFTKLRKRDGTFRAVEMSLSLIVKDPNGFVRVAGTITDIEERRRAERALGEAEKKYRNIVQNAAGGIYQLTPEGLYLSANPALARILGFDKPEQLLREVKDANESVYVEGNERFRFVQKLQVQQETLHTELQMRKRDGEIIWVSESARAVRDEAGQVLFIEGSVTDVTERKKSELTIKKAKTQSDLANRAKSEFLSNMSHELRTPLNSIIGFSEMIKDEVFGPVGQKSYWEYAKDIHESGQHLLQVINEILDISKIEAGERQLHEGAIVMQEIVQDCVGLLEHKIENNDLTVTVSMDGAPNLVGEALSVKQMLMNLLSNAVKFTPKGGRVTISTQLDQEGRFHLSVTDTGVGLDEEEIEKALSAFGQVNSELSRSGSGTGLGLTLVDSLIKLHGGDFELFSQKGIGTTATIIFPANRVVQKSEDAQEQSFAQSSKVPE